MDFLDTLLTRNARFAAADFSPELKMMPSTGTVVVGCVDPRVDPAEILALEPGEVAVIRNVGGVNKVVRLFEIISEEELRNMLPPPPPADRPGSGSGSGSGSGQLLSLLHEMYEMYGMHGMYEM